MISITAPGRSIWRRRRRHSIARPPEGPIELVVPRADGGRPDVYPLDDRTAHVHLVDLALALMRRLQPQARSAGREPA